MNSFAQEINTVGLFTVDLDKLPQQGCPACGNLAKTVVLWPKTTPAQVPLAPAKTPLKRPEKATGRVAVNTAAGCRACESHSHARWWQAACTAGGRKPAQRPAGVFMVPGWAQPGARASFLL